VQGTIVLRCVITVEGRVTGCRVLKSLPELDEEVIATVQRRRYRPAQFEGTPVEVEYTFTMRWRINP
jgi:protein TonB